VRGITTPTLRGDFQSPAYPPRNPDRRPALLRFFGPRLQRFRRSYHDQRGLRSPLDTLAQRALRSPLQPSTRGCRAPWTHDRCSAPASTKRRYRSPFGNPSTSS